MNQHELIWLTNATELIQIKDQTAVIMFTGGQGFSLLLYLHLCWDAIWLISTMLRAHDTKQTPQCSKKIHNNLVIMNFMSVV